MFKFKSIQFIKSMVEIPSSIIKAIQFHYNLEEDCVIRIYFKDSNEFLNVYDFADLIITGISNYSDRTYTTKDFQITNEKLYMLCYDENNPFAEDVIMNEDGKILMHTGYGFDDFNILIDELNSDIE